MNLRRKLVDKTMTLIPLLCVIATIIPLISISGYLLYQGTSNLNWAFLTELPKPVGESGGGMANSIVGTGIVVGLAGLLGIPIGILAGVYLAEYGQQTRLGKAVRFIADVLQGVPSIVIGIVAYAVVVVPMQSFSAYAGAFALAMMLVPFLTRTTEEALLTVPDNIKEAGLALGQPYWRVVTGIVLRAAKAPIFTGVMLGIARIAGETAPLLFTALNNRFWHQGLTGPISTLTIQIYNYAISPFQDWNQQAWSGALVLIILVTLLNLIVRISSRSRYTQR
ncbi:MAG TPA: phosphate ABC transporter permease PstA [Firmicutes bacterium]|nr:phosphate ABC transporter permease PstA [Bacillota bacterium]